MPAEAVNCKGEYYCAPQGFAADPINTRTGALSYSANDLEISTSAGTLAFEHTYVSSYIEKFNPEHGNPFGYGWVHNQDLRLIFPAANEPGFVHFKDYSGNLYRFWDTGIGRYVPYAGYTASLTRNVGTPVTYTLTDQAQNVYTFDENGKVTSLVNPTGQEITYDYDAGERLERVSADGGGRYFDFTYNAQGQLTTVTDHAGRSVSFGYDAATGDLTSYTDVLDQTWQYEYQDHLLTKIEDPDGNQVERNEYYPDGKAWKQFDGNDHLIVELTYNADSTTTITDALGNTTMHAYDTRGTLVEESNAVDAQTYKTYDHNFRPLEITNSADQTLQMTWSADGVNLLSKTDPAGNTINYEYDSLNNLTLVTDPRGFPTTYTYDGKLLTKVKDALNGETTYAYTPEGFLESVTDTAGRETSYTYNSFGQRLTMTDPSNNTWYYTYDSLGRLIDTTDPRSRVTHNEYNAAGKPIRVTQNYDPSRPQNDENLYNIVTEYEYDVRGNQIAVTDTYGRTTQYVYDDADRLLQTIDALGNTTTNTYDAAGRLISTTDPLQHTTSYEYDAAGRLIKTINHLGFHSGITTFNVEENTSTITDMLGRQTVFHYDALGRVVKVVDPLGHFTTTTYDPNGNVATRTDQLGRTTYYEYDELNRLVKTIDPNGGETETFYDEDGNRIATEDPLNHRTEYTYDDVGRLIATTDPLDRTTSTEYDEYGRRAATIDAAGHRTTFTYDILDRVITVTDDDGNATHTTYDALGNVLASTDANGNTTTTAYDELNRPLTVTDAEGHPTTNTYDAAGNLIEVRDALDHTTHYTYDELNRQIAVTDPLEHTTQSSYDALGNLSETVDANGVVTRYEYDELNRQVAVILNNKPGVDPDAETNIRYEFVYNEVGNRISVEDPKGKITTYGYDTLNRLIEKKDPLQNTWSYTYDLAGNRISATDAKSQTIYYAYDAANQLIAIDYPGTEPDVTFTYDLNGQRIGMTDGLGTTTWTYDDLNRLIAVTDAFNQTIECSYDAVGNRIELTYPDGKTVTYTYDRNNRLKSVTDWDQQETEYSYNEVGQLSSVSRPNGVSSQYVYDNAGRLEELEHTFGLNTLASYNYTYDPAGNRTRAIEDLQNPQMASANPGGFAGSSGQPSLSQGPRFASVDVIALKPAARDEALFALAYQIDPTETPTETSVPAGIPTETSTLIETPMGASTATGTPVLTLPASQLPDASESPDSSSSDESNLVDDANLPAFGNQIDTKRPPVGVGIVDDTDSAWKYVGTWTASKNAASDRGTLHRTTTSGNYAELTFTGTQFTLTLAKDSKGGSIDVYVDGNKVGTIDANSPHTLRQSTWNSPIFAAGDHTVRLVHAGGSGKHIDIDTIEIENLPMPAATDTTETAENSLFPSEESSLSSSGSFAFANFTVPRVQAVPASKALLAPSYQEEPVIVTAINARSGQTCAITSSGGLKCWGWNGYGQLGDGTTTQRSTPVDVSGLTSDVTAIALGYYHTCAVTSSGGVKCWGQNTSGKLGDGTTNQRTTPVDVVGLSDVMALAAGGGHTCAVTSSGGVKCWGSNYDGQLGDGTTTDRLTPVNVSGLSSGVVALAASGSSTCALTSSGGVKCWGHNSDGQLGDGTTTDRLTPVDVSGLTSEVTAITAGAGHMCALTDAGGVKCWGWNNMGQLGDGSYTDRTTPVDVIGFTSGIAAIDSSHYHNCAITTSGGVRCWGSNYSGQHGDGSLTSGVVAIAVGNGHSCALMNNGGVQCWGNNGNGQLGDGTTTQRLTPVDVSGLTSGTATIVTRYLHTCALTSSGGAKCWSINGNGQLGDGTNTSRTTPVNVSGLTSGVASIATGQYHTCAVTTSGGAKCWGLNGEGQLGQGAVSQGSNTPLNVSGLTSRVTTIVTGSNHSCALTSSGGVKCWGKNANGQVGDGTTTLRAAPVNVNGLTSGVTAIAAGNNHTCAVTSAGGVKCWGINSSGQLGDSTTTQRLTPVDVSELSDVVAISAGDSHTCALTTSGGIKCWGSNGSGRLGDGTYTNSSTPVDVSGLTSGVSVVSAGGSHTCAVMSDGIAKCWGNNYYGQLGDGTKTYHNTPVDVSGLTGGATTITAGSSHTCAVTTSGGAKCWGESIYGQLGDGALSYRSAPAYVIGLTGAACYPLTLGHTGQGSDPLASPINSTGCSTGEYVAGESISLSGAVPDSGWEIDSWTGTENDASTSNTNTVTMPASAHTVNVNYIFPSVPLTIDYTYDALNRLTGATYSDGRNFGYTYDPAGNVLELQKNLGPGTIVTTYSYDAANQLATAVENGVTWQYHYDENGSLIETLPDGNAASGAKRYTYNTAGYLMQVEMHNGSGWNAQAEMDYNGLGQRLSMDAAGVIAHYVVDGNQPLTATSENTTFYLYGLGPIAEKTSDWAYSLPDGLNTPRQLTNPAGEVTLAGRYTPWGDILEVHGAGNFTFGYLGGVMDLASGLIYVGNGQYYDPFTGRFLTRGINPNGTNPYVPWNPIGAILGPLGIFSLVATRKRGKHSKGLPYLLMLFILVVLPLSIGMACEESSVTPTEPVNFTVTVDNGMLTATASSGGQVIATATAPAPSTPIAVPCPTPNTSQNIFRLTDVDWAGRGLVKFLQGQTQYDETSKQAVFLALDMIQRASGKTPEGVVDWIVGYGSNSSVNIISLTGDSFGGGNVGNGVLQLHAMNTSQYMSPDGLAILVHEMGHGVDESVGAEMGLGEPYSKHADANGVGWNPDWHEISPDVFEFVGDENGPANNYLRYPNGQWAPNEDFASSFASVVIETNINMGLTNIGGTTTLSTYIQLRPPGSYPGWPSHAYVDESRRTAINRILGR
ncbi:MAG: hypothetical protein JW730_07115 [Anaerolineales bacterium]|nr:hypothetical protein [Anaerolineales bacterium]